jgi:hypothetical protein
MSKHKGGGIEKFVWIATVFSNKKIKISQFVFLSQLEI